MARAGPRLSVRLRLLIIALLPMLILMPALIGVTMQRWIWRTDQILAARVASDLTVARQYLAHLVERTGQQVEALGQSVAFRDRIEGRDAGQGAAFLAESRQALGLDFLLLTPPAAFAPGGTEAGIEVLAPAALEQLAPGLAARARIAGRSVAAAPAASALPRPAENAPMQTDRPQQDLSGEDRGMVIRASTAVRLADGTAALLTGGVLLNRNEGFIDQINDLVYPATDRATDRASDPAATGSAPANGTGRPDSALADQGITTLFLDDMRIATTLRPGGGERAIGTRASTQVRDRVLRQGGSWNDTAYVVGNWYISAYEAITDGKGARIGMLYTGIPKAPYTAARRFSWTIIGAAFIGVTLLTVPLFLHWARGIFRPLEAMGRTLSRVEAGEAGARSLAGPASATPGADEILRLARHLDRLLDLLQERERDLRSLNADLNLRVEARTADLVQANRSLETAMRQLVLAEKLATIGEVTAGVAHEINNPLAVIQGNLEVLQMALGPHSAEVATEMRLIDEQVRRIGALVNQLLQFTRPDEFAGGLAQCDPAAALGAVEPMVRHLLLPGRITLEVSVLSTRQLRINIYELQQILVNLTVNAIQSMPGGGTLRLQAEDAVAADGRKGVRISVHDTGAGMQADVLARIFDPFFTTRGTAGTGLGLSICQTLVSRYGGELSARSVPGSGSVFTLWLPSEEVPAKARA